MENLKQWISQFYIHLNRCPLWGEKGVARFKANGTINEELGRRFRIEVIEDAERLHFPDLAAITTQNAQTISTVFDEWVTSVGEDPHAVVARCARLHDFIAVDAASLASYQLGWGLQILPSGDPKDESAWRWLQPKPNHLVVNLGDVFVCWTGGILRSNVHRIRHAPGEQRLVDRYSFTIAARAASGAPMHRKGNVGNKTELDSDLNTLEFEKHKTNLLVAGTWKMKTLGGRVLSA